jgi:hypothetical protein
VKAAPNHPHRHGFRRRLRTTVPCGRLVGVIGVSHSSPGLDEAESAHFGREMRVDNNPREKPQIVTALTGGGPVSPEPEIQKPSSAMGRAQDGRRMRLVLLTYYTHPIRDSRSQKQSDGENFSKTGKYPPFRDIWKMTSRLDRTQIVITYIPEKSCVSFPESWATPIRSGCPGSCRGSSAELRMRRSDSARSFW